MEKQWKYIDDQMEIETRRSFKKAIILSTYHDSRLQSMLTTYPILQSVYDRYHPLHLDFNDQYFSWNSIQGTQTTKTDAVGDLFKQVKSRLSLDWDPAIQIIYKKNTLRYKEIFPEGKKPFRVGEIDTRIGAFNTLLKNIGADNALDKIAKQIDAEYQSLLSARKVQVGAIGNTGSSSGAVETARVAAMNMQYRNVGFVMDQLFDVRDKVLPLIIDLKTLRQKNQVIFTGSLANGAKKEALEQTFLSTDTIAIKLTGTGSLKLYLATDADSIDSDPIPVAAKANTVIKIADFKVTDLFNHRSLIVASDGNGDVKYRIDLL